MSSQRQTLISAVATRTGLSSKEVDRVVTAFFEEVASNLTSGISVRLHNFGSFTSKIRPARAGRHPKSGETMTYPAKATVKFNPFGSLTARLMQKAG